MIDRTSTQAFLFGLYFAIVQFAYFFLLDVYISSRTLPFFIILFFWLIGSYIGLQFNKRKWLSHLLTLSVMSYYTAFTLIHAAPYQYNLLPLIGMCALCPGLLSGYFFVSFEPYFEKKKYIFLHENNGFLCGILCSTFVTLFAGKWFLLLGPALGIIPIILHLKLAPPRINANSK